MNSATIDENRTFQFPLAFAGNTARVLFLRLLGKLQHGRLTLHDGNDTFVYGRDETLQAHVTVHSRAAYAKILFGGSIGAAEAYIDGLWEVDDLTAAVRIMVRNLDILEKLDRGMALITAPLRKAAHQLRSNTRQGAKKNILAHYDLGNSLYASFLDDKMMYSSAIYPDNHSSLEKASTHKLDIICNKLNLGPEDHVLEIGSGWGGFAIHAASRYGCRVTTTTISKAQYREAARRIAEAGLTDRITLLNKDYRDLTGRFDKLVSIEMIEAVGVRYLPVFFQTCSRLLKQDGAMLLQAITIRDQQFSTYAKSVDFIQSYIFPGGCLVSNEKMVSLLARKTDMVVRGLEDFGLHYARTLNDWRHRFNKSFSNLRDHGFDERFRRLWQFYLCYCEGGFLERSISVVHLLASKPEARVQWPAGLQTE